MPITLATLKRCESIEKVIIHSHDLSLYLCSVIIDGEEHYLVNKYDQVIKAFNKLEFQALFEGMAVEKMVLRQQSAYDEMVGQPLRSQDNTLEVTLGNRELGGPKRVH